MKFIFYTPAVSPHQLPLVRELVRLFGKNECGYIYTKYLPENRKIMGWADIQEEWILFEGENPDQCKDIIEECDVLMVGGVRDLALFKRRTDKGKCTIYCSERWFKPRIGIFRLFNPSYLKMARKFVRLLRESDTMYYFPMGIHAARDMARLCGLFAGDLRCLITSPQLEFERTPGGMVYVDGKRDYGRIYCLDKMRMWGYFVESSGQNFLSVHSVSKHVKVLRVLWVGRFLRCKRIDTIIRAIGVLSKGKSLGDVFSEITLDIYGTGPEESRLREMAVSLGSVVRFHPPVTITEVRKLMREHDIYVLASDAFEGWGAVVSEALEEGMKVVGTYEAGSSATMLPESNLFHTGDWQRLVYLLSHPNAIRHVSAGDWTAKVAAEKLWKLII